MGIVPLGEDLYRGMATDKITFLQDLLDRQQTIDAGLALAIRRFMINLGWASEDQIRVFDKGSPHYSICFHRSADWNWEPHERVSFFGVDPDLNRASVCVIECALRALRQYQGKGPAFANPSPQTDDALPD